MHLWHERVKKGGNSSDIFLSLNKLSNVSEIRSNFKVVLRNSQVSFLRNFKLLNVI